MQIEMSGLSRLSRRTILALLVLLVIVSLSVRYPFVEHERYQTDSYFIHHLSYSIAEDNLAKWTYHPLSYVGYYPLSYPSGAPFLIAEFSMMSGIPVEASIFFLNLVIAVIFCLGAFLVAKHFIDKPQFAVLAASFVILGSRFVDTTYWNGSARGPAVAMMLLVIVAALASANSRSSRAAVPIVLLTLGSVILHHMGILLLLFGAAYVLTYVVTRHVVVRLRRRALAVSAIAFIAALVVVAPLVLFDYFWSVALRGMQSSVLARLDSEVLSVIVVAASSYLNQIGFVIVFALTYIYVMVRRAGLSARTLLPVFLIVVLLPLFGEAIYVSMLLSPFVAILAVRWFDRTLRIPKMRGAARATLVVLVAVSVAHPLLSVNRWNENTFASGDQVVVGNQIFNDAAYADNLGTTVFGTCNVVSVEVPLQALSKIGFLSGSGIVMALNGDVSRDDVLAGIRGTSHEFPRNLYSWYEYDAPPPIGRYTRMLMVQGVVYLYGLGQFDGATEYFSGHSNLVVFIDNRWLSEYVTLSSSVNATFPDEIRTCQSPGFEDSTGHPFTLQSYIFYESDLVSMFLVELPTAAP